MIAKEKIRSHNPQRFTSLFVPVENGAIVGYEIHIDRDPPISLDEWKKGVASFPNLRLNSSPTVATNPNTGETITMNERDGCVAILIGDEWRKVFRFFDGCVNFYARVVDLKNLDDPTAKAAFELAHILEAKVVGDEGEEYTRPSRKKKHK
jgi:hypothetical protein